MTSVGYSIEYYDARNNKYQESQMFGGFGSRYDVGRLNSDLMAFGEFG